MGGNLLVSLLAGFGDTFHVVHKVEPWRVELGCSERVGRDDGPDPQKHGPETGDRESLPREELHISTYQLINLRPPTTEGFGSNHLDGLGLFRRFPPFPPPDTRVHTTCVSGPASC